MIYPIIINGIIKNFKVDTKLKKDEINNFDEIKSKLELLGYSLSHYYQSIPMFTKGTYCKSLGDLINIYNIPFSPRQNNIKYGNKLHIISDTKVTFHSKYDREKFRQLKELYNSYKENKDESIVKTQLEIVNEMAQVLYNKQAPILNKASLFYALPKAANHYFNTLFSLSKKGDQLCLFRNYQLSTSTLVACILLFIKFVSKGYGGVYYTNKYCLLNNYGRYLTKTLRPSDSKENNATVKQYLSYLDSFYDRLSNVTGDKYPKCKFIINEFGQLFYKVPSLIYYEFV